MFLQSGWLQFIFQILVTIGVFAVFIVMSIVFAYFAWRCINGTKEVRISINHFNCPIQFYRRFFSAWSFQTQADDDCVRYFGCPSSTEHPVVYAIWHRSGIDRFCLQWIFLRGYLLAVQRISTWTRRWWRQQAPSSISICWKSLIWCYAVPERERDIITLITSIALTWILAVKFSKFNF